VSFVRHLFDVGRRQTPSPSRDQMQPMLASVSNAATAALAGDQRFVKRIQHLRAIEADHADAALGFDQTF
jgi:hypothetical protein